jgi:general stress protein YciG
MDIIFGSEGAALKDQERMAEINQEIGLATFSGRGDHSPDPVLIKEKGTV